MSSHDSRKSDLQTIRIVLVLFIAALVASGITAFPLLREMEWLASWRGVEAPTDLGSLNGMDRWIDIVRDGLRDAYGRYPWMAYGTDWLAFGHITIALFFVGPLIRPAEGRSTICAGIAACFLVIPLALA